jgi:hypothetical protein
MAASLRDRAEILNPALARVQVLKRRYKSVYTGVSADAWQTKKPVR